VILTRSEFLAMLPGAAFALAKPQSDSREPKTVIDFHVHLFGTGDGGTGCFLSAKQKRRVNYRAFLSLLNLSENGRIDEDYVQKLVAQMRESSLARAVLVGQDCRYDTGGKPDFGNTSFFVPNDYLLRVAHRFPELFVPCISVNPKRRDAVDELERCAERGARVLKIHPPIQDVDPGEGRFRPFYRRCAEKGIIIMVHTGAEHLAEIVGDALSDPLRLVPALEEGAVVVAAHSGTAAFFDREDFFPHMITLVRRFPNLYCDTAVMASMFRWRALPRLLDTPEVLGRAIHGSDFPFPANALVHWNRLSRSMLLSLLSERNLLERDYRLKRAIGIPAEVFGRGAMLLEKRKF